MEFFRKIHHRITTKKGYLYLAEGLSFLALMVALYFGLVILSAAFDLL